MPERDPAPILENHPLHRYSSFGIGGPARYFSQVRSKEEMRQALLFCQKKDLPFMILGKGSNLLFDDRGYSGMVILNKIDSIHHSPEGLFQVGSGFSFALLGSRTAREGWSGLEFASGIPGTVGGAVFMNAGANGRETAAPLQDVLYMDASGNEQIYSKPSLLFSYRSSPFQKMQGAILSASFLLHKCSKAKEMQREIVDYRMKTQPYRDKSAGCAFVNPGSQPAGQLIDRCGLKGFAIGEVEVSSLHANFIVNKGKGTSHDVLKLIEEIQKRVYEQTGTQLHMEIRYIPYQESTHP